jgi:3-oxoacyl-[acyl-carrier-protein] synthase II
VDHLDLDALRSLVVVDPRKLSRMDAASALAVAAAGSALARMGASPGPRTAVVVGTETASIENDELFHRRLRERGVSAAEPRRFPPTSPNLPAGQCGIAFGLQGPSMGVGIDRGAALEALLVAHDLVAAGDAEAAVVVAAEHVAEAVPALWTAAGWPVPTHGAMAVVLESCDAGTEALDRSTLRQARDQLSLTGAPGGAAALMAHAVNR